MPTKRVRFAHGDAILTHHDGYKPGDQPPADPDAYNDWHAWAEVQHKAGLRQEQCGRCGRWCFPQQLSGRRVEVTVYSDKAMTKPVTTSVPVCLKCNALYVHGKGASR